MEKETALAQIKEERKLAHDHASVEPEVGTSAAFEELIANYESLSQRIDGLGYTRTVNERGGSFFDGYIDVEVPTDDEELPVLNLRLQTGYALDLNDAYDPKHSVYLVADWSASNCSKREVLYRPKPNADVDEATRILGLIEESVTEAEKALLQPAAYSR